MLIHLKLIFLLILQAGLNLSNGQAWEAATSKTEIEKTASNIGFYSGWGLVEITKLDPLEDLEGLDCRYAKFPSDNFNAQIVLIDANRDGLFESDNADMIGITQQANFNDGLAFEKVNFQKLRHGIKLKLSDKIYRLDTHLKGERIGITTTKDSIFDFTYPVKIPEGKAWPLTKGASLIKSNGRYTYYEFWGTWCKPCIEIIPEIKALHDDYKDQLNVISIDFRDPDIDRVKEFITRYHMNWDHLIASGELMKGFNVRFYPCGILYDPSGKLIGYALSPEEVRSILSN